MSRSAGWDFGYAPVVPAAGAPEPALDLVVATHAAVDPDRFAAAAGPGASAHTLLARAPIFWTALRLVERALPDDVAARLTHADITTRYVASAERPSLALGAPLDLEGVPVARPTSWAAPRTRPPYEESGSPGMWFLGEGGVAVDRARFGSGEGTRLAVIDDDALYADQLDLDAEVPIGLDAPPRHGSHGALMVAWASGARGFAGVAPGASRRLYLIPKPGVSLTALPLALARAVLDGADVIVCATYVEGSTSPMLSDALDLAAHLGRRGRGTAVVFPTGREASSLPGSLHASFSLGLGEPASDPRVFCIAPSARGEGWFLWPDRRGKLRPFANRGPAVRWLAPGDDIAYPFNPSRLFHAESSGASAVAAGVLLLILGANRVLRLGELAAVADAALCPVEGATPPRAAPFADGSDVLPAARDRDGHNAKHGYGRLDAGRACLVASDPVCAALVAMGEDAAARAFADARRDDAAVAGAYSWRLGRWAARALLADREASHALRVVLRHLRLASLAEGRLAAHGTGALSRCLVLLVRRLSAARPRPSRAVRDELLTLASRVALLTGGAEGRVVALAARIFSGGVGEEPS